MRDPGVRKCEAWLERFGPLVTWADVAWAPEIVPHHFPHGPGFVSAVAVPWLTANAPALV